MKKYLMIYLVLLLVTMIGLAFAEDAPDYSIKEEREGAVYIEYKIRTDDFYAETKERNIFQGNADPVWQLRSQVAESINNEDWTDWVSVADVPGSTAYKNGAWYNQPLIERWSGTCLSDEDNIYIRIQGFENENSDINTYVSGTDSYYSYDSFDQHLDVTASIARGSWSNFINTEPGNGDFIDCGAESNNNYYKAEIDLWWDYMLPDNPDFSITDANSEGFTVNLTDNNNYRITTWEIQVSTDSNFNDIVFWSSPISESTSIVTGLNSGSNYWIRICGSNERGSGSYTTSKSYMTTPIEANIIFPYDGSDNLPRTVTVNWKYDGDDTPSGFKVIQNGEQVGSDIPWSGDKVYYQRLSTNNWGVTVSWKVLTYNTVGDYIDENTYSFTVRNEPEDVSSVASAIVYAELLAFTGTSTPVLSLPEIVLGQNEVSPTIQMNFETSVSNISTEIRLFDQPEEPLPQPQNCSFAVSILLPTYRSTTISIDFQSSTLPTEVVWWNGANWEDITDEASAVFSEGLVVFEWTSWQRGIEKFAINNSNDTTLPVELSSFTAISTMDDNVSLNWTTQSESNLLGFNILKSIDRLIEDAEFANSSIIYAQNTNIETIYDFFDIDVENNMTYWYWLTCHKLNGEMEIFGPLSVKIEHNNDDDLLLVDSITGIKNIYPNPFNPSTTISFVLREDDNVLIDIFNLKGQRVYTFKDKPYHKGVNSVVWNGVDSRGNSASADIYFAKMRVGNKSYLKKMILLK